MSSQLHASAALPPIPIGWMDLRAGVDDVEKRKFFTLPELEL
jgi:hypothetical protein